MISAARLRQRSSERLQRREQVLVLLNRRGYATAVFCRQCGDTFECPNCSISLTVHTARQRLAGALSLLQLLDEVPKTCRKCAAPYLEHAGFGTEKVEQHLRDRFPDGAHRPGRSRLGPAQGRAAVAALALRGRRTRRARRDADDCQGARLPARHAGRRDLGRRRARRWPTSAPASARSSC